MRYKVEKARVNAQLESTEKIYKPIRETKLEDVGPINYYHDSILTQSDLVVLRQELALLGLCLEFTTLEKDLPDSKQKIEKTCLEIMMLLNEMIHEQNARKEIWDKADMNYKKLKGWDKLLTTLVWWPLGKRQMTSKIKQLNKTLNEYERWLHTLKTEIQ